MHRLLFVFCLLSQQVQGRNIVKTIGETFGFVNVGKPSNIRPAEIAVIGAGASRSGTQSLTEALEILGFPVYNLIGMAQNRSHLNSALEALQDRHTVPALLEQALDAGYTATLDTPMNLLWNESFQRFPSAKIVVSVRDNTETWLKSFQWAGDTFAPLSHSCPWKWLVDFGPLFEEISSQLSELSGDKDACVKFKRFVNPWWAPWVYYQDAQGFAPDCLRHYYEAIIPTVSAEVPKDQLLVFNVKQGWKPLCDFLGVPIPERPFPNVNSSRELLLAYYILRLICWAYPFLPMVFVYVVFACFSRCMSRSKRKLD